MSELKPCPFCGEQPASFTSTDEGYYQCGNGDCPLSTVTTPFSIREWNTRAPQSFAELREKVDELCTYILGHDTESPNCGKHCIEELKPKAGKIFDLLSAPSEVKDGIKGKRKIVCLCGSTRFWREFQKSSLRETLAGNIVLSIGAASGTDDEHFGNLSREEYDRVKRELDELHKDKITIADEVLVLNVDNYIGESTRSEIEHAQKLGKPIRYLIPRTQEGG